MKVIAKALIFNDKSEILLIRRSASHPRHPLHLDLPGGEVESGELPPDAVCREILEETGLTVDPENLQLVYQKQANAKRTHLLYTADIGHATSLVTLSWEHDAFYWMTRRELLSQEKPSNVDQYFLSVLDYLRDKSG